MQTPLRYQMTDFDCGTTAVLNALIVLFDRHEIPPELIKEVTAKTLDRYGNGRAAHAGTSGRAMRYLGWWLEDFGRATGFPVSSRYLGGDEVTLAEGSPVRSWVDAGGVAVVGCRFLTVDHYITVTDVVGDEVRFFDPSPEDPRRVSPDARLRVEEGHPERYNRSAPVASFCVPEDRDYSLACKSGKDALLIGRLA